MVFGENKSEVINNEPWFVGKDVAEALGYKDTVNAIKSHIDIEDKERWQITTPSGGQSAVIINESGLYSLVLSSKLPGAKQFKRWITAEVFPPSARQAAMQKKQQAHRPLMPKPHVSRPKTQRCNLLLLRLYASS